jgi:chromate transporter
MSASLATLSGLMVATLVTLARPIDWSIAGVLLGASAFAALRLRVDVLWVVLAGAVVSLAFL